MVFILVLNLGNFWEWAELLIAMDWIPQTLSTREVELNQWIGWRCFANPPNVLDRGKIDQKLKIQGYSNKNMSFIIDSVLPVMSR